MTQAEYRCDRCHTSLEEDYDEQCPECGETGSIRPRIRLKEIRKALWWGDPSQYKHRINAYKRNKLEEIRDHGLDEVHDVDLSEPQRIEEDVLDEDYWRAKTRDLWEEEDPEGPDEIFDWYGSHTTYIVENMIRQAEVVDDIRQVYYWLRDHDVQSVLDYGGGVGDFSLYLATQGYDVTYADVQGSFPDFVSRRDAERKDTDVVIQPIHDYDWTPSDVTDSVDAAVCLEVIEHLPDVESVIDGFADVIAEDGVFITSWTFNDWSDDPDDVYTPCHINTGRDRSREVREYMEQYFEELDHTWNAQMRLWRRQ